MKRVKLIAGMLIAISFVTSCDKDDDEEIVNPDATVVKASGDLTNALAEFRQLLGEPLNNAPGSTSGRREINWDGVPVNLTNNSNFPFDFFNSTDPAVGNGRKRGLVYVNSGTPLRVDTTDFSEIEPTYATQFKAFSPKRSFSSVNSNVTEVVFKVAGTNIDATIKGFGVIFSDVDDPNYTTLEFFSGAKSLGVFKAPAASGNTSFSFLGVHFKNDKVTKVRITAGNAALAAGVKDVSNGGTKDVVVMDDFFYDEPLSIQ